MPNGCPFWNSPASVAFWPSVSVGSTARKPTSGDSLRPVAHLSKGRCLDVAEVLLAWALGGTGLVAGRAGPWTVLHDHCVNDA